MITCLAGLGGNAAEVAGIQLHPQGVADLDLGVDFAGLLEIDLLVGVLDLLDHGNEFENLDLAQLIVEMGLEVAGIAIFLVGRGEDRRLERLHQHAAVDPFVLDHLVDDMVQVHQHAPVPL